MNRPRATGAIPQLGAPGLGMGASSSRSQIALGAQCEPQLNTGTVIDYHVNNNPGETEASHWSVTIQPQGTSSVSSRVRAECLFDAAAKNSGMSGIPRPGSHVYFLQVNHRKVCLGAIYTNVTPSPWPDDPKPNSLRSTGMRIPDLEQDGAVAAVSSKAKGLLQSSGLLVAGTTWWDSPNAPPPPTPSDDTPAEGGDSDDSLMGRVKGAYDDAKDWADKKKKEAEGLKDEIEGLYKNDRDLGSASQKKGLSLLDETSSGLQFNEVAIQSRVSEQDDMGLGGVSVYGQDFISQTTHGSVASTALGDITHSAGGNIHIEASKQITLQVGGTGLTITEGGVSISQNSLATVGTSSFLNIGQTSIDMFASEIKGSAVSGVKFQAMGSIMSLEPLEAKLVAFAKASCACGWINMGLSSSGADFKADKKAAKDYLKKTVKGLGKKELKSAKEKGKDFLESQKASRGEHFGSDLGDSMSEEANKVKSDVSDTAKGMFAAARGHVDGTLAKMGLPWNMNGGDPWAMQGTLPALEGDNSWQSLALAFKSIITTAGESLTKEAVDAKAAGFVAEDNEAYTLGGFYLNEPPPAPKEPSQLEKLKSAAQEKVMGQFDSMSKTGRSKLRNKLGMPEEGEEDERAKGGKLDKLKAKAAEKIMGKADEKSKSSRKALMEKIGAEEEKKEEKKEEEKPDPLEEAAKKAFGSKRIILPVLANPQSGLCLMLAGGSSEIKAQLFEAEALKSMEEMDEAAKQTYAQAMLAPILAMFAAASSVGAAKAALAKTYASWRSDKVGNTNATIGTGVEMTTLSTKEVANKAEATVATEEAVAATVA